MLNLILDIHFQQTINIQLLFKLLILDNILDILATVVLIFTA